MRRPRKPGPKKTAGLMRAAALLLLVLLSSCRAAAPPSRYDAPLWRWARG